MIAWWKTLSQREQALLGVLALLLGLLVAWYGVWRPVVSFHQNALARHEQAARENRAVLALAARVKAAPAPQAAPRPLAETLRQSLEAAGITAARLEADPQGGMRVALGGVASTQLLPWIAGLQTGHGITPRHLVIVKEGQGMLGLDATFAQAGG